VHDSNGVTPREFELLPLAAGTREPRWSMLESGSPSREDPEFRAPTRSDEEIAFLEGGGSCGSFRPVRAPYYQALRHSCQAASCEEGSSFTIYLIPGPLLVAQREAPPESPRLHRIFRRAAGPGARMRPPCTCAKSVMHRYS